MKERGWWFKGRRERRWEASVNSREEEEVEDNRERKVKFA